MSLFKETFDWISLIEDRFKLPEEFISPIKLQPSQKDIAHFFQYGCKRGEDPKNSTILGLIKAIRGSGKTTIVTATGAIIACEVPGTIIGLYGSTENDAIRMMDYIKGYIENSRYKPYRDLVPKKGELLYSRQEIQLRNYSHIRTYTASYNQIIGPHEHVGLIDEAVRIGDDLIYGAILPKFSRIGKRVALLSSPKEFSGAFARFWNMADIDERKGNKRRFTRFTMDAVKEGFADKNLRGLFKSITPPLYKKREYEGKFAVSGGVVYPEQWIEDAMSGKLYKQYDNTLQNVDKDYRYCGAIDFGVKTTNTSIAIGHKVGDLKILDYMETFEPPVEKKHKLTRQRLYAIMKVFPVRLLVPDATGAGDVNVEQIMIDLKNANYPCIVYRNTSKKGEWGFYYNKRSKRDLFERLQDDFADQNLVLPYHFNAIDKGDKGYEMFKLKQELKFFRSEHRKNYRIYDTQTHLADRVHSLALMCLGLEKFHPYTLIYSTG